MKKKIPKVRIARPKGRPIQLRYFCPVENREIRISTGGYDESAAEEQKQELEAKLLLGQDAKPRKQSKAGPNMLWEDFRERYYQLHLSSLRPRSSTDAEYRLDLAERILKPRTLADVAYSEALHDLQRKLLAGEEPRDRGSAANCVLKPRSPHTVKTYMAVIMAALNWAAYMEWLPAVPKLKRVKTSKLSHMKGRPITLEEFERMIDATESIVGQNAAASWRHVLFGLWESGLRIGELLSVHWTDENKIAPIWDSGPLPVLSIPADMQKNDTEESIPLLPGFEALLIATPEDERKGWVFNPVSLKSKIGRKPSDNRLSPEWAGKIIGRIGEKAGVVVQPAKQGKVAKFASAHDLRRSCADRLVSAGVPERDVAAVMRHASVETTRRHYAPGSVQRSASVIREKLKEMSCS